MNNDLLKTVSENVIFVLEFLLIIAATFVVSYIV